MLFKFLIRLSSITAAFIFLLPYVQGVKLSTDIVTLLLVSLLFNILFATAEWILDVVVIGINISTLSIGVLFSRFLEFIALVLAPAAALYGCSKILPPFCEIANFYPDAVVAGITLGGVLFAQELAADRK